MELGKEFSDKAIEDFKLIDRAIMKNDETAYAELMK
jgi:RNA polymerase sigma-70 factor (ECF subfamily)